MLNGSEKVNRMLVLTKEEFYQGFHFYLTANDYWLCRCYLCCILLNKTPARIVHYEV